MKKIEALTFKEVCKMLRVSPTVLRGIIARGELRAVRAGKQYRVHPDEVERYLKADR